MNDPIEIIRGSGNVFRDLGLPYPEIEQLKSILAVQIIRVLDERSLSVRAAHDLTGFAAADFSRVRQAKLGRFTIDRLMTMLTKLGVDAQVAVSFKPMEEAANDSAQRMSSAAE